MIFVLNDTPRRETSEGYGKKDGLAESFQAGYLMEWAVIFRAEWLQKRKASEFLEE